MNAAAPRTRRPTGAASWPRVLLSGEDGTPAAWLAAEFTADDRIVTTYWLEVGTGRTGDEYAAVPGADYELLDHDGTWTDIYGQVSAAWETARAVSDGGAMPSALVVNGMSAIWSMLTAFADRRARRREAGVLLRNGMDPDPAYSSEVDVEVKADLWTLVGRRHDQLMAKILTWPGPVILIAREKRSSEGRRVVKVHESVGAGVTAWVRLALDDLPEIAYLSTARHSRLTAEQRAELRPGLTLTRLVWDWSGCGPDTTALVLPVLDADQVMPDEEPPVRAVRERETPPAAARPPDRPSARTAAPKPAPAAEAPATTTAKTVAELFDLWMALDDRGQVQKHFAEINALGAVADADITSWLDDREREVLQVPADASLTLRDLSIRAGRHVMKTGQAIRPNQPSAAGVA